MSITVVKKRTCLLGGAKVPENFRSQEWKFPGTFAPGSESSQWELSLRGAKIPRSEKSLNPDYGFVYWYWATVNTKVRPALDGEDCRRVYITHFWLYYILFIIITITFSYIPTTEISASAQSAAGRRGTILGPLWPMHC